MYKIIFFNKVKIKSQPLISGKFNQVHVCIFSINHLYTKISNDLILDPSLLRNSFAYTFEGLNILTRDISNKVISYLKAINSYIKHSIR